MLAREWQQNLRNSLLALLGNKCVRCGFSDPRALQIDHVRGGGIKEIKLIGHSRIKYLKFLIAQITSGSNDYQLLCANCNWIKRTKNNENLRGGLDKSNRL
jgi:hypothetical protein